MKCSFKNIRINVLLFTAIMTLSGRGSPIDENEESRKNRDEAVSEFSREWDYIEKSGDFQEIEPHRLMKKKLMLSDNGFERPIKFKAKLEPQIILQRKRVSLTHFPREMSRRKEEGSVIRQRNFRDDNTRRRVAVPYMRNGDGKRRTVRYRNYGDFPFDFGDQLGNRRRWPFSPKWLTVPEPYENGAVDEDGETSFAGHYEPFCGTGRFPSTVPNTYMVEVEPGDDREELELSCAPQQAFPLCNKYYYVFERRPFKVKFLNLSPYPCNECMPPMMAPTCGNGNAQNCNVKLSLPAFQCRPPECREVLYCKYFQCTSLGFFPDSRNCRKYFFCDLNSNGFVLYHMLCPKGRIFDPELRECRLRDTIEEGNARRRWIGTAKLKRDERMRIKKNLPDTEEVIRYKEPGNVIDEDYQRLEENPKKVRRKSIDSYEIEEINSRHGPKHFNNRVQLEGKETTVPPVVGCPCMNFSTQWIPIPVFPTVPNACQPVPASTSPLPVLAFSPAKTTTTTTPTPHTRPKTIVLTKPSPTPTKPPLTTKTTAATTTTTTACTTTTCATTTTQPPPMTTVIKTTLATTPVTNPVTKSTLPICPPPPPKKKNHTCFSSKNVGQYPGEASDNYQYEIQDEYGDDYYGAPEKQKEIQESTYDWLKQSLNEYLDLLKRQKENPKTETVQTESNSEQSIPPVLNDVPTGENSAGKSEERNKFLTIDFDRGKRSQNSTTAEASLVSSELPDFEKCYNDQKQINLDGYPCKQYKRYPDKFDSTQYYECGAQPDGNMRIEHKRCPEGELFSPEYLECIATEFMKLTHRKKRFPDGRSNGKTTTTAEPDYNEENDKDIPSNEWIDANHPVKIPNEFKSKAKHNLRIFHLKCKRNLTGAELCPGEKCQSHDVRSFEIRPNKKDTSEQLEDEDDEEYEDEEEYYEGDEETLTESSTSSPHSGSSYSLESSSYSTTSSKVLLDANIHVDREFENALKNILGKAEESERNKDSILIRLSGEKSGERSKRNFIKDLFSKKSKDSGDDPEKEGVVSMLTLINGLPSQYERDALMQKLEKRKMLNSHIYRNRQRIINRKRRKRIDKKKPSEYY